MNKKLSISRRDFLNGVALSLAAGTSLTPLEILARQSGVSGQYHPPARTGMRGSHPGSFEVAHALVGGERWARPERLTDDIYDLIVVGGGLSGLSAAFFYRQRVGADARILVLDNHDDFGGHATRNEFDVDGKKLICYGGSQSIDTPGHYSKVAKQLLKDVGIHTERFYDYFDRKYFRDRDLARAIYFSEEEYGADSVHADVSRLVGDADKHAIAGIVHEFPLSDTSRSSMIRLLTDETDYLHGKSRSEKIALMRATSYMDFLVDHAGVTREAATVLRDTTRGFWGLGWDALSALEAYRQSMPGTHGLGIGELKNEPPGRDEPYIFHFPDGNAGVARSLVRQLIPVAVPGDTMEDLVLSHVDYLSLDRRTNSTRIRLNSTVVNVGHVDNDRHVDVTYVYGGEYGYGGEAYRVRGKHVVLACYNQMIPFICSELPEKQVQAIAYATKVPLVYVSVALRNWKAFDNLGYHSFYIPQGILMHSFGMDFPVSMGGYDFTRKPDDATVIHGTYVPTVPDRGLTGREQHIAGRWQLYEKTFDEFEQKIVRQISGALVGGGFDAERDIAAITVNRWPHGYAYEYNEYSDPLEYNRYNGPHIAGAAQIGRISIANSDASAYAYINGAVDAADRAVSEQIGRSS